MSDYYELKIKINPEMSDIISDICFENFDCEGVVTAEEEYQDNLNGELTLLSTTEETLKAFIHSSPTENEPPNVILNSFQDLKNHCKKVLAEQRELLLQRGFTEEDLGSWEFELSKVENQDWSKKWKENWDVTHVSKRIAVVPSWLEYTQKENEITIKLDPGSAFGTGTHPTTQLCMRAIEKHMRQGAKVADIGMGSGILAVCAVKFGAKFAYGCDNDELVIQTAKENAEMNGVGDKCVFEHKTADQLTPDVILNLFQDLTSERPCDPETSSGRLEEEQTKKFDFVLANILHNVLAEIMNDLKNLMADDATLVLSGILDEKKQVVIDAIKKHNLKLIEETHQDIWVGLTVKLNR